jgi:hypothetical protein
MKNLIISLDIEAKLLNKHQLRRVDVERAFLNRDGNYLQDTRAQHLTNPITEWFISENDRGQRIKIVFVALDGQLHLRTAYLANPEEIRIYEKYAY